MPTRILSPIVLAALVSISACAPATGTTSTADTSKDQAAIATTRDNFQAAVAAGDAAKVASFYTTDAIWMRDNQPSIVGRDAIQKAVADELGQANEMLMLTPEETKVMGDMAYDRGTYMVHVMPKAPGAPIVMQSGRYLVLLQKQADGTWQLTRDFNNSSDPLPAPAAPATTAAPTAKTKTK